MNEEPNQQIEQTNISVSGDSIQSHKFTPGAHSASIAVQSVAQSMAIAVQDSADMLRNISTIETTAIGAATAKWLAEPANVAYKEVIETSQQQIEKAAQTFAQVGAITAKVLKSYADNIGANP